MSDFKIPLDTILFISGVPGAGKSTISYELLYRYDMFRIVQETDLIREILRGYNESIMMNPLISNVNIPNIISHNQLLSYEQAKGQCELMKYSIQNVVNRQMRKKIPTIINGVHIIPEILSKLISHEHTKYINLYFDCESDLYNHVENRDKSKYGIQNIQFLFDMNSELKNSVDKLHSEQNDHTFFSVNVGKLSINETIDAIVRFLEYSD